MWTDEKKKQRESTEKQRKRARVRSSRHGVARSVVTTVRIARIRGRWRQRIALRVRRKSGDPGGRMHVDVAPVLQTVATSGRRRRREDARRYRRVSTARRWTRRRTRIRVTVVNKTKYLYFNGSHWKQKCYVGTSWLVLGSSWKGTLKIILSISPYLKWGIR